VKSFGGISTLVNNVGWGGRHEDPAAITEEEFIASYKLNTISAYRMSMACLPHLLQGEERDDHQFRLLFLRNTRL
jgi:7-alpha-hydroxysteroid dehydrogenase